MNVCSRAAVGAVALAFGHLLMATPGVGAQTDATVSVRHIMTLTPSRANEENPTTVQTVRYIHADLRRIDTVDANGIVIFTRIDNCSTRSGFVIDPKTREFKTERLPRLWSEQAFRDYIAAYPANAVHIESRTVDMGEKKTVLGLTAKHYITTIERIRKNGPSDSETIDGWYVEHQQLECQPVLDPPLELRGTMLTTYPEVAETHHTGPVPNGLALEVTDTVKWNGEKYGPNGRTLKSELFIERLSSLQLDPKIFSVPAGFRENPNLLKPGNAGN